LGSSILIGASSTLEGSAGLVEAWFASEGLEVFGSTGSVVPFCVELLAVVSCGADFLQELMKHKDKDKTTMIKELIIKLKVPRFIFYYLKKTMSSKS
jgi:hypothetical protein